jgi:phosphohistidine phosphatase SixA
MKRLLPILLLASVASAQTIFVVRHAEKVSETVDALNDAGKERASCLAGMLKDAEVKAIYASPTERARQTSAPLASAAKVKITEYAPKDYAGLASRIRAHPDQNALVVGHSNTVPDIIKALGVTEPAPVGDKDYDWLFVVTLDGKTALLLKLHYCSPAPAKR